MDVRTVYIICSGPSLKGYDFTQLKGKNCIAVNESFKYIPETKYLVALDTKHYVNNYEAYKNATFPIYTVKDYNPSQQKIDVGAIELENTGPSGLDYGEGIRHGFNSGYLAINIAIKLGYNDIRILGMDLTIGGHFYDDERFDYRYVHNHLKHLKEELRAGINITFYGNETVTVFDTKPLEDAYK